MGESGRWTIEVTAEDMERSRKRNGAADSFHCMVSIAIARTISDATHIDTDIQTIRFTRQSTQRRYIYLTPYSVQGYISAFDAGEPVKPFKFRLTNPHTIKRTVNEGSTASKAAKNPTTKKTTVHKTDDGGMSTDALALAELLTEFPEVAKAAPKVFKSKRRNYGARVLRWNQIRAEEEKSSE